MYDLHIHSLLSDGQLLPSEIARRYEDKGYKIIAITDHCDFSNIENNIKAIVKFCKHWPEDSKIKIFPGAELTHIPLEQFKPLVKFARELGAKIIVAHGETSVEPVVPGTNREALLSGIDILAHPGNISEEDALLAKERGIFLELTARAGHARGNIHLVKTAILTGANLIINNDAHSPQDIIAPVELRKIGISAGLNDEKINQVYKVETEFLKRKESE